MLARLCRARDVLEIGSFTGYATMCLADGMRHVDDDNNNGDDNGGAIIACEADEIAISLARSQLGAAELGRVTVDHRLGDPAKILREILREPSSADPPRTFDLIVVNGPPLADVDVAGLAACLAPHGLIVLCGIQIPAEIYAEISSEAISPPRYPEISPEITEPSGASVTLSALLGSDAELIAEELHVTAVPSGDDVGRSVVALVGHRGATLGALARASGGTSASIDIAALRRRGRRAK